MVDSDQKEQWQFEQKMAAGGGNDGKDSDSGKWQWTGSIKHPHDGIESNEYKNLCTMKKSCPQLCK